jgi:hypothetical protein
MKSGTQTPSSPGVPATWSTCSIAWVRLMSRTVHDRPAPVVAVS